MTGAAAVHTGCNTTSSWEPCRTRRRCQGVRRPVVIAVSSVPGGFAGVSERATIFTKISAGPGTGAGDDKVVRCRLLRQAVQRQAVPRYDCTQGQQEHCRQLVLLALHSNHKPALAAVYVPLQWQNTGVSEAI